jgi:hypothetical protein
MKHCLHLLVSLIAVSGCATTSDNEAAGAKELAVTLSFVAGDRPLDLGAGIYSVGDYFPPRAPVTSIRIAPGSRNIGYNCPGYIFVDGSPTVWHKFQGGKHYELFCNAGKPIFRVKPSQGA